MRRLIIHMDIRPLHIRQTLQLRLQLLSHIMCLFQTKLPIHHNVDFDNETRARMPCAHGVELGYARVVRHGDVGDVLKEGCVGGDADEELEFLVGGAEPEDGDEDGEDDGAQGVDPPAGEVSGGDCDGKGVTYAIWAPRTLVIRPKPLMKRSLRWSSQRMRIWLYLLRNAQQYKNRPSLVAKAMPTAMTDGMWNLDSPDFSASCLMDSTIRIHDTVVIRKQKVMLPAVSSRALPEGKRLASTLLTARLQRMRVRLLKKYEQICDERQSVKFYQPERVKDGICHGGEKRQTA